MRFYFEERLAVLVLVALLVAAALWRAERRCPRALLPGGPPGEGETVSVTVLGAVSRPGGRRIPRGANPRDAASAAGPASDADLASLDPRVPCADGEVIYVPRAGEGMEAAEAKREAALKRLRRPARVKPLDINRASAEDLAGLPGVGEKLASAVVLERTRAPFRRVEDLRRVPGIGPAAIERLRGEVCVGEAVDAGARRGGTKITEKNFPAGISAPLRND